MMIGTGRLEGLEPMALGSGDLAVLALEFGQEQTLADEAQSRPSLGVIGDCVGPHTG